ncbi:MAG: rod shape-determining protein MreC [bacterium]
MLRNSRLKFGVGAVALAIFFVFLGLSPLNPIVKELFYATASPLQKPLWRVGSGISSFFNAIGNLAQLNTENEELKKENRELLSLLAPLVEKEKENQELRDALGIMPEKEFIMVIAEPISRDIGEDTILINRGKKDGIIKGMAVVNKQTVLLGKICEVYDNFSKVSLVTNKDSYFSAKLQNANVTGVVKGQGRLTLSIELLPKNENIKEGDSVVTVALGGDFPEGIFIGEVTGVKKNDIEPFMQAEIEPGFDINEVEKFFIIVDY